MEFEQSRMHVGTGGFLGRVQPYEGGWLWSIKEFDYSDRAWVVIDTGYEDVLAAAFSSMSDAWRYQAELCMH